MGSRGKGYTGDQRPFQRCPAFLAVPAEDTQVAFVPTRLGRHFPDVLPGAMVCPKCTDLFLTIPNVLAHCLHALGTHSELSAVLGCPALGQEIPRAAPRSRRHLRGQWELTTWLSGLEHHHQPLVGQPLSEPQLPEAQVVS